MLEEGLSDMPCIYGIVRSVARSGLSCKASFYMANKVGKLCNVTYRIAALLDLPLLVDSVGNNVITISCAGIDPIDHIRYRVSDRLFKDPYRIKAVEL